MFVINLQAETSDLQKTLDGLKQQDPTLQMQFSGDDQITSDVETSHLMIDEFGGGDSMEKRGFTELERLVDGLTRAVTGARERVTPLSQRLIPLRLKVADLKDERDSVMQVFIINRFLNFTDIFREIIVSHDISRSYHGCRIKSILF